MWCRMPGSKMDDPKGWAGSWGTMRHPLELGYHGVPYFQTVGEMSVVFLGSCCCVCCDLKKVMVMMLAGVVALCHYF